MRAMSLLCLFALMLTAAFAQAQSGEFKVPGSPDGPSAQHATASDPPPALDENDPLGDVTKRMGTIAANLEKLDTGEQVRQQQTHVVSHLDELIERLRRKRGG